MNADAFRQQVRELLGRHQPAAHSTGGASRGVCVPLRLASAGDLHVLADLARRVAASPALAEAHAAGLLRFELSIDPGMAAATAPTAETPVAQRSCCEACARGEACHCERANGAAGAASAPAIATPLLRGVVTERDVKALPASCRLVGTAPRAVLTPLARDALRQRGIAVQALKES